MNKVYNHQISVEIKTHKNTQNYIIENNSQLIQLIWKVVDDDDEDDEMLKNNNNSIQL